jgi:hypothetical protein
MMKPARSEQTRVSVSWILGSTAKVPRSKERDWRQSDSKSDGREASRLLSAPVQLATTITFEIANMKESLKLNAMLS